MSSLAELFSVNNSREQILANIRHAVSLGLPEIKQQPFTDRPVALVGGGPSLSKYLPVLRALASTDTDVLAINGAYKHLRGLGIEADHFVLLDSREANVCHVDSPSSKTNHFLASQVHPAVFDGLRDYKVTLFHAGTDTALEVLGHDQEYLAAPVGMASIHAIYVAVALGYRNLFLFGYDFSSEHDEKYAYDQPMNAADELIDVSLNGKRYRTTITLARTADVFLFSVKPLIEACGTRVEICSDGLLSEMVATAQSEDSAETEKAKYESMWEVDAYRSVSPGLESIEEAFLRLEMRPGDTCLDLGCGTGRVVTWLRDRGIDAIGIDIADNALEEDVPFFCQALWEPLPAADFGFSCDVLEHIPPAKLRETLRQIHDATKACFLNADTIADSFGVYVGRKLHLTVLTYEQWEALLKEFWAEVEGRVEGKQAIFVCRRDDESC